MKRILWFILLMILVAQAQAQNETIREEIENAPDSKILLIHKGRNLLLEKFKSGDYQKVKEIKEYLVEELDDKDYQALYIPEYWFILYWTQEYDELLRNVRLHNNTPNSFQQRNRLSPMRDLLYTELREKSANSSLLLEMFIEKSELDTADKQFASMFLKYLIMGEEGDQNITQENLNIYANDFLKQYPQSDYGDFVKKYIHNKQTQRNWAAGFDISGGYTALTENLGKSFNSGGNLSLGGDIYYKRVNLNFQITSTFSKNRTEKTLPEYDDLVWKDRAKISASSVDFALGYALIDNRYLNIAPFAGIGGTIFAPLQKEIDDNSDMKKFQMSKTTFLTGVSLDFKIWNSTNPYNDLWSTPMAAVAYIRLRYTYRMPQFEKKYSLDFAGDIHTVTLGVGIKYR